MATPNRPRTEAPVAPGTAGDGQDNYPTYHDRPGSTPAAGTRPTDSNLPQRRRTSPTPMLIGLVAFAVVVGLYIIWSVVHMAGSANQAMTPGNGATAPAATSTTPAVSGAAIDSNAAPGTSEAGLDHDVKPQNTSPAPAAIPVTPGAVDVPGGSGGTQPAPAQ